RRRLAFDELLLAQLSLLRRRAQRHAAGSAPVLDGSPGLSLRWREELLPFDLTGDQLAAIAMLDDELAQSRPMQRLLMGEVGSGKTVVALHAILRAVEHDLQAAFMAPTEVLAEQHFATLQTLLPGEAVRAALLTGSTSAARRADILGKLASGELQFVVGTHALVEEDVRFGRLAVVVVDEQHRFGVRQRAALDAKAGRTRSDLVPHVLHMTATPIPRTMALLRYGDLDVTALRELPRGRKPVATHVASSDAERARAYDRIREELDAGRQAFVVCPLVEESEALAAKAATAEFERLRGGELAGYRVELLHGQMRSRAKQAAMAAFAAGGADVLVATTVIEVGVDVPNATVMLVEGAERYGISQLHQLRGRVGRGEHASLCLLFGPKNAARLRALAASCDGFELAQIDLELRGEGELAGTRQSGLAQFKVARLPQDEALAEAANAYAEGVLEADPDLTAPEHALLADALAAAHGEAELQPLPA
ncbi:MAG: DEAD/DEAH box helicase, partial [Actinomycetota bacterium]|nr:DEAD/DEAH box helicase [Actinomycetota bacterium]